MFSTTGLFKNIPCPNPASCQVPNCIFSHDATPKLPPKAPAIRASSIAGKSVAPSVADQVPSESEAGSRKRRKLEDGTKEHVKDKPLPSVGGLVSRNGASSTPSKSTPKSATRPVSPPAKSSVLRKDPAPVATKPTSKQQPKETLNPRMVTHAPVGHATRKALLDKLHEYMKNLNDQVVKSSDAETKALRLTEGALIKLALDEEQKFAEQEPLVYSNVIKHRIMAFKKMTLEEWIKTRQEARQKAKGAVTKPPRPPFQPVDTGLTPAEEVLMLSRLITPQAGLDKHGYVTKVPSEEDIEKARKGVEAAYGFEVCDRCGTKFQVFPERREDGALTTGGNCVHHWGRAQMPPRSKGSTGHSEQRYGCCQDVVGAEGCTTCPTHVFKVSEAKRLAYILPFVETPENPDARTDRAICFDCEMGYTAYGLELIRLTATSWPSGDPALDILVRPRGAILDLNTRFSGVTLEQFSNAPAYDPKAKPAQVLTDSKNLVIMPSPAAARDLLLTLISPSTPLLGHALENDLNSIRLVHPNIVDTIVAFSHPKGLPFRFGLRHLAKRYLNLDIQTAGAAGHDSLEDARATGELARYKVKIEWDQMKRQGWTITDGVLNPPLPREGLPLDIPTGPALGAGGRRKRRVALLDGSSDLPDEEDWEYGSTSEAERNMD